MTRTMKICRTWNEVDIKRTGVERERKRKFLRGENDEPKTNFFFLSSVFETFFDFFLFSYTETTMVDCMESKQKNIFFTFVEKKTFF